MAFVRRHGLMSAQLPQAEQEQTFPDFAFVPHALACPNIHSPIRGYHAHPVLSGAQLYADLLDHDPGRARTAKAGLSSHGTIAGGKHGC
jgi:hypothetical protein